MSTTDTSCLNCKWINESNPFKCKAFPDGIPQAIVSGELSHIENIDGDNGFKFEPKDLDEEA